MANLLFVCAGNSCRSPMAMIIAQSFFNGRHNCDSASGGEKVGKTVASKAVSAIDLLPGIEGSIKAYAPKPLSDELVHWADHIFFLGENLLHKAQGNYFGQAKLMHKMKLYDPVHKNVPDPFDGEFFPPSWIGSITKATPKAYEAVAEIMLEHLTPQLADVYKL